MPKATKSVPSKRTARGNKKLASATFKILDTGVGLELGTTIPPNWQPLEICYYKLGLSAQGGLRFVFLPSSGYVDVALSSPLPQPPNQNPMELHTLLQDVVSGADPDVEPFDVKACAPHIIVKHPCFVVIELDSTVNWRFLQGAPAIKIGTNFVPPKGDPAPAYFSLTHFDTDGLTTNYTAITAPQGNYNAPDTSRTCRLIAFGIDPRPFSAKLPLTNVDKFNIYLEIDNGFGQFLPIVVDPDIKNEGGSIPPFLPPPGSSHRKRGSVTG